MMGRSGEEGRGGGAVYTTASVPIYWAGAVTQELLAFSWAGGGVLVGEGGRVCESSIRRYPIFFFLLKII